MKLTHSPSKLRTHDISFKNEVLIIPISKLLVNPYNCNKMDDTTYSLLKNEVRKNNYDPIIVSPLSIYDNKHVTEKEYIILDGEHRTKCAIELDQTHMRCLIHPLTQEEALPYYYKRQNIHGTTDGFKESNLFNYEKEQGRTSHEIAERYGLSSTHVKYRQGLRKICSYVLEKYDEGLLSISHLEVLATESEEIQIYLSDEAVNLNLSVHQLALLKQHQKTEPRESIGGSLKANPRKKYKYSLRIGTLHPLSENQKTNIIIAIKNTIDKENLMSSSWSKGG